jgi:hypothetical protein
VVLHFTILSKQSLYNKSYSGYSGNGLSQGSVSGAKGKEERRRTEKFASKTSISII